MGISSALITDKAAYETNWKDGCWYLRRKRIDSVKGRKGQWLLHFISSQGFSSSWLSIYMLTAEDGKQHLMPVIRVIINFSGLTPDLLMERKWKRAENATNVLSFSHGRCWRGVWRSAWGAAAELWAKLVIALFSQLSVDHQPREGSVSGVHPKWPMCLRCAPQYLLILLSAGVVRLCGYGLM